MVYYINIYITIRRVKVKVIREKGVKVNEGRRQSI